MNVIGMALDDRMIRAARFGCEWDAERGQYWTPRENAAKLTAILRSPVPSSA